MFNGLSNSHFVFMVTFHNKSAAYPALSMFGCCVYGKISVRNVAVSLKLTFLVTCELILYLDI